MQRFFADAKLQTRMQKFAVWQGGAENKNGVVFNDNS
jgi:hypothetical protein